ncbi:CheR family methyltransferase [Effusibacillus consociatus]|uniref:protein-glutamate O-methyltransferase n=2 Tax=Effusibacillus consociatus TaxID=1117041 RepID=A0ABV9Q3H8_9BACL
MVLRQLGQLIYDHCGLNYLQNLPSLESKISKRTNELGMSIWEYTRHLEQNSQEWDVVVELLTINETYFCREENQLEVFQSIILPQLTGKNLIRIWSAACSTGEEPYTLAMMVAETGFIPLDAVEILATDINKKVLQTAKQGWYSKRSLSFRRMPEHLLEKYFVERDEGYQVVDSIRNRVRFRYLNLLDQDEMERFGEFDVIFCRNVLIYFDRTAIQKVVSSFYDRLAPEGSLFLGHAESITGMNTGFETIHTEKSFYYRKGDSSYEAVRSLGS